jgi:hypothetical protein
MVDAETALKLIVRAVRTRRAASTTAKDVGSSMNAKQLKEVRKSQHELLLELRGQLEDDAYARLKAHLSSALLLIKDSNTTTEERLLAENETLKKQLAEKEEQHRAELARVKHECSEKLAAGLAGVETSYKKKTARMEADFAALNHVNAVMAKGLLCVNEVGCTSKALSVARGRFRDQAVQRLFRLALDATAAQCADRAKQLRLTWGDLDATPYLTPHGWNVFISYKGELGAAPKLLTVREHELRRALG